MFFKPKKVLTSDKNKIVSSYSLQNPPDEVILLHSYKPLIIL